MQREHLVRWGRLGHVGRFTSVDAVSYPRHAPVVLRTSRGLELGEVLAVADDTGTEHSTDGSILRAVTVEDRLLEARLDKNRQAALDACALHLSASGETALLMDVEFLFDGQTLLFYFLGDPSPHIESLTEELAELYESHAKLRKFATALGEGCGPDCGTHAAGGCHDCGAGCAVAGACKPQK
jgi:hypothetical protein